MWPACTRRGLVTLHSWAVRRFFRKDLPQILRRAKDVGYTRVGVTTNGTVLSKAGFIRKLADSGLDFIEMSIHAHTPELANTITRNNVTFDRQASALAEISEVKLFTIVNVVICRENKDHLIDVSRYVLENHRDIPVRFKFKFVSLQGLAMEEEGSRRRLPRSTTTRSTSNRSATISTRRACRSGSTTYRSAASADTPATRTN